MTPTKTTKLTDFGEQSYCTIKTTHLKPLWNNLGPCLGEFSLNYSNNQFYAHFSHLWSIKMIKQKFTFTAIPNEWFVSWIKFPIWPLLEEVKPVNRDHFWFWYGVEWLTKLSWGNFELSRLQEKTCEWPYLETSAQEEIRSIRHSRGWMKLGAFFQINLFSFSWTNK